MTVKPHQVCPGENGSVGLSLTVFCRLDVRNDLPDHLARTDTPGTFGHADRPGAPRRGASSDPSFRISGGPTTRLPHVMGSLIKKRRKRMRKKKHKKMLKRTRFQRRAAGK